MVRFLPLISLLTLLQCTGDETLTAYGGSDTTWALQEIDGQAAQTDFTLVFPAPGTLSGVGPCNTYSGIQTAPYPWFKAERIKVTERACPDLDEEEKYLDTLSEMTLSEVAPGTLILSNDSGREMVFHAQ